MGAYCAARRDKPTGFTLLFSCAAFGLRGGMLGFAYQKAAEGQPQSKSWRRFGSVGIRASVLDCGCPLCRFHLGTHWRNWLRQPAAKRSLRPRALSTAFRLLRLGLPLRESWR